MNKGIDEAVDMFSAEMRRKLCTKRNLRKTHWGSTDTHILYIRLLQEAAELEAVLELYSRLPETREKMYKEVVKECADVANFAMMIADNVTKEAE